LIKPLAQGGLALCVLLFQRERYLSFPLIPEAFGNVVPDPGMTLIL
jgi:hypothetical protein